MKRVDISLHTSAITAQKMTWLYAVSVILLAMTILFCTAVPAARAGEPDYRPLQVEIKSYLEQQDGFYGFHVIDIKSNVRAGINDKEVFHAASTFKVPMALYVFKQVARGDIDPGMLLEFRPEHREGGTGVLQYGTVGARKSVEELVRYALVYSDNVATNMLLDLVGRKAVKDYMDEIGGSVIDYRENITCPGDMAMYMLEVVRFAEENYWGDKLLGYLRNTAYTDRIPYPLEGVTVANKIGNWPPSGTYNDVAYVEHPERPYILAVFSRQAPGYGNAVQVIREISRRVYGYQGNPARTVTLVLDGRVLNLAEKPFVSRGVTLVPLRALAEAVTEVSVGWDQGGAKVVLVSAFDGIRKSTDLDPSWGDVVIIEGTSYIPVRNLARLLDLELEWNGKDYVCNLYGKRVNLLSN